MTHMNDLAVLVNQLEDQLVSCTRCGMCQAVCPLFEQTGLEADVARGKLALLTGLMTRKFKNADGVIKRLNKCLLCGSCAANCPSGVNVLEIFIRARAILTEYDGLSPVKKIIFRRLLSSPQKFDAIMSLAEKFQTLLVKQTGKSQGTSCARFATPLLSGRHILPMAAEPFHRSTALPEIPKGDSGIKAALFTGCLIDKFLPKIAHASIKALYHHHVEVFIPENQGCCGIPALAAGDQETFDTLLRHHSRLFRQNDFDYLVTACATCTSTIRKLWPSLYRGDDPDTRHFLDTLKDKTMDISQFLIDIIGVAPDDKKGDPAPGKTVTYHDPCHLKKSLGIFIQPRQLIKSSGVQLVEMEDADKCCGMGGSFNLFHYDISHKIGTLKQQAIAKTDCSIASSGCPACIMQISDMLSRSGSRIRVKHPVELYADALPDT